MIVIKVEVDEMMVVLVWLLYWRQQTKIVVVKTNMMAVVEASGQEIVVLFHTLCFCGCDCR